MGSDNYKVVNGYCGIIDIGPPLTFDDVYGSGAAPLIVAHDKAVQRLPSMKRIEFHAATFGPVSDKPNRNGDIIDNATRERWLKESANFAASFGKAAVEPSSFAEVADALLKPIGIAKPPASSPLPPDSPAIDTNNHQHKYPQSFIDRLNAVYNFDQLIPVAHELAVSKGWWTDGLSARPLSEVIANFHSEVSEAWEEYRAGRIDMWHSLPTKPSLSPLPPPKPEGFWIEIADLLIRIADAEGAARALGKTKIGERFYFGEAERSLLPDESYASFIRQLHAEIVNEGSPVMWCETFANRHHVDLYDCVRVKMHYNLTRPYRHGGKKA